MKKAILAVVLSMVFTLFGQGDWSQKGLLIDEYVFQFLSTKANTLFIAGDKLWKSTDGGITWTEKQDLAGAQNIFFLNENVGWIAQASGSLLKTTDAGESWNVVPVITTATLVSVHFINENVGYVVRPSTKICKTTDGGQTWNYEIIDPTGSVQFQKITFCPESNSWFLTGSNGKLFRKTGEAAWELVNLPTTVELNFISFKGGKGYIASKEAALLLKSTDGGMTWSDLSANMVSVGSMLHKHANNLMFGETVGRETTDGGATLINVNADNDSYTSEMFFAYDGVKDYVYTSEGKIFSRDALVGIEPDVIPQTTELNQNYPNPFNPTTTINFSLTANSQINLAVYNINGQLVRTLVNKNLVAGSHAVEFNAENLNSGVYFYRLSTPTSSLTKKMILIK